MVNDFDGGNISGPTSREWRHLRVSLAELESGLKFLVATRSKGHMQASMLPTTTRVLKITGTTLLCLFLHGDYSCNGFIMFRQSCLNAVLVLLKKTPFWIARKHVAPLRL